MHGASYDWQQSRHRGIIWVPLPEIYCQVAYDIDFNIQIKFYNLQFYMASIVNTLELIYIQEELFLLLSKLTCHMVTSYWCVHAEFILKTLHNRCGKKKKKKD